MPIARSLMGIGKTSKTGALTSAGTVSTSKDRSSICVSADGKHVYAGSTYSDINVFSRNTTTGALSLSQTYAIIGRTQNNISVSSDGKNVYYAVGNSYYVMNRDTTNGNLASNSNSNTVGNAAGMCISPDDKNVYIVNAVNNLVQTFNRNSTTGALTANGNVNVGLVPKGIAISSDGKNVYVANANTNNDGGIYIFSRDTITGVLSGNSFAAVTGGTNGTFTQALYPCVSPDGKNVYVCCNNGYSRIFSRNTTTGLLDYQGDFSVSSASDICISPDGINIYVLNNSAYYIYIFNRSLSDGSLTSAGTIATESSPNRFCISPDGNNVYVTSTGANTVDWKVSIYNRS